MSLESELEKLRGEMEAMHAARETALKSSRQLIQTSSKCIRHVHRHQFDEARQLLETAKSQAKEARSAVNAQPMIEYAGYLQDAEKELTEAAAMLAIAVGEPIPTKDELGVEIPSYLNGLGEAASECRRYVLDQMRHGHMPEAERMLEWMESVYAELISFDFPDGLTGGLRRTCDALRAVVERTRSDLTLTISQRELLEALKEANSKTLPSS